MRPRYEGPTLAERLNNALGELHSLKLQHERDKALLSQQLDHLKGENERLKAKQREIKRQQRETTREADHLELNHENQHTVSKIKGYLQRIQQSSKQLTQVATECMIVDADIEKAATQIEKNILKSRTGLEKYLTQLMKRWGASESLRIQNQRLQIENRELFQLTSTLQQNFRETDQLIKQWGQLQPEQDLKQKINQLEEQNAKLKASLNGLGSSKTNQAIAELKETVAQLSDKLKTAEQENTTIKSIHQRTMKKLEKLEQEREAKPVDGEGIQQERKKWLEKTQEMYEEIRRLTKQLMLSEESQKKVREELNSCIEIYSQWEQQREDRKIEIEELKVGVQIYLHKIEELESKLAEKNNEIQSLEERVEIGEGEKQKIVSVYQLQVQELNDHLFKKQDVIAELEAIVNREHYKHEELKKQFIQANNKQYAIQKQSQQLQQDITNLNHLLNDKSSEIKDLEGRITKKEQDISAAEEQFQKQLKVKQQQLRKAAEQKAEILEVLQEYQEDYYSLKKDLSKACWDLQKAQEQQIAISDQLRAIVSTSNNPQNIWEIISSVRQKYSATFQELKTLKSAQIKLLDEIEARQKENSQAFSLIRTENQRLVQELQAQQRNQTAQLQIWKMRVLQSGLCNQSTISKASSMSDLIAALSEHQGPSQKRSSPIKDRLEEQLQLKERLMQSQGQVQSLKQQLRKYRNKLTILQQDNFLRQKLIQDLEAQLKAGKEHEKGLLMKNQALLDQLDQAKAQLANSSSEVARLKNKAEALQRDLQGAYQQAEAAKHQSITLQSQLDQALAQTQEKHQQITLALQRQLDELMRRNSEFKQQREQQYQSSNTLKQHVQHLTQQIEQLQNSMSLLEKEKSQYAHSIEALLAEISTTNSENTHLMLELKELKEKTHLINDLNQTLKAKYEEAINNAAVMDQDLQKYRLAFETAEESAKQWQQKQSEALVELRKALEQKQANHTRDSELVREQLMNNGYEMMKLTLELEERETKIEGLEVQISTLQSKFSTQNSLIETLKQDNSNLRNLLKQLQDRLIQHESCKNQFEQKHYKTSQVTHSLCQLSKASQQPQYLRTDMQTPTTDSQLKINHSNQLEKESLEALPHYYNQLIEEEHPHIHGRQSEPASTQLVQLLPSLAPQQHASQVPIELADKAVLNKEPDLSLQKNERQRLEQSLRVANQKIANLVQQNQRIVSQMESEHQQTQLLKESLFGAAEAYQLQFDRLLMDNQQLKNQIRSNQAAIPSHTPSQPEAAESGKHQQMTGQMDIIDEEKNADGPEESEISNSFAAQAEEEQDQIELAQRQPQLRHSQTQISILHQQIAATQQKASYWLARHTQLAQQLQRLTHQFDRASQEIIGKTEQLQEARQQLIQVKQQFAEAMHQLSQVRQQLKKAKCQSAQRKLQQEQFAQSISHLQEALAAATQSSKTLSEQLSAAIREKQSYGERLVQIQDLMQELRHEDGAVMVVQSKLNQALGEKKELQERVSELTFKFEASEKKISEFQRLQMSPQQIKQSNIKFKMLQRELESICKQLEISQQETKQLETRLSQSRADNEKISADLASTKSQLTKAQLALSSLKAGLQKTQQRENQHSEQMGKLVRLQSQCADLREELSDRGHKVDSLKMAIARLEVERDRVEQLLKEKSRQLDIIAKENEHYKAQIKKINKEKVLAENEAYKHRFNLEEQQSAIKLRESQVSADAVKHSRENDHIIKQLKRQNQILRQSNEDLQRQCRQLALQQSNKLPHSFYKDLPLQITPTLSKNISKTLSQQLPTNTTPLETDSHLFPLQGQAQVYHSHFTQSSSNSSRVIQSQLSNSNLTGEVSLLRGELKSKTLSIQTLEKQYKTKIEDYSRLQRKVQSLNDELSLQRRRVKNFEQLYQNIQSKRLQLGARQNDLS